MQTINPLQKTKNNRHPLFAFGLSLIVLSAALLLLWLGQLAEHHMQDKVVVREIAMVALPPPPPPSISQQQTSEPMQSLAVEGAGASIQAVKIKIKSDLSIVKPDTPNVKVSAPQWQSMSVNWDAFSLNQLDGLPTLLTPVKAVLLKIEVTKDRNVILLWATEINRTPATAIAIATIAPKLNCAPKNTNAKIAVCIGSVLE